MNPYEPTEETTPGDNTYELMIRAFVGLILTPLIIIPLIGYTIYLIVRTYYEQ